MFNIWLQFAAKKSDYRKWARCSANQERRLIQLSLWRVSSLTRGSWWRCALTTFSQDIWRRSLIPAARQDVWNGLGPVHGSRRIREPGWSGRRVGPHLYHRLTERLQPRTLTETSLWHLHVASLSCRWRYTWRLTGHLLPLLHLILRLIGRMGQLVLQLLSPCKTETGNVPEIKANLISHIYLPSLGAQRDSRWSVEVCVHEASAQLNIIQTSQT